MKMQRQGLRHNFFSNESWNTNIEIFAPKFIEPYPIKVIEKFEENSTERNDVVRVVNNWNEQG